MKAKSASGIPGGGIPLPFTLTAPVVTPNSPVIPTAGAVSALMQAKGKKP